MYDYLLFDARHTKRWRDKIGVWFRRTGWRPADVEARYPKKNVVLEDFRKFDPPTSRGMRRYAVAQFVVAIAVIMWIGDVYLDQGLGAVVMPCLGLWVLLFSLGVLNEGRGWSRRFERLRLLLVVPAVMVAMQLMGSSLPVLAWVVAAIYVAGSLQWLMMSGQENIKVSVKQ